MNKPCVPFPGISSIFSFVEPFLPYSFDASHCLASHCLLEPSSQACLGKPEARWPNIAQLWHLMWACGFLSWILFLLNILASWMWVGCLVLALPPLLVLFFIIFKSSTWSSWLILTWGWGTFSCSTCGFSWGTEKPFLLPKVDQHQLQLFLLCKCANTTKWTTPCACVLAFHNYFQRIFTWSHHATRS